MSTHEYMGELPGWCSCGEWFEPGEDRELAAHLAGDNDETHYPGRQRDIAILGGDPSL